MPDRIVARDLTAEERAGLERIARARNAPAHLVERATIILGSADGHTVGRIAREAGVSRPTVSAWVRRFDDGGLAALRDRPRSGRPPTYGADQRAGVVAAALDGIIKATSTTSGHSTSGSSRGGGGRHRV